MQRLIAAIAIASAFLFIVPDEVLYAQSDSVTAIVLSPRVGVRLTALDCSTYRIFTTIPNLESAIFLVLPDSSYGARVRFRPDDVVLRDTVIFYSFRAIERLGERIDHFEDMVEGSYTPGSRPAHLRFVRIARSAELAPFDTTQYASTEKASDFRRPPRALVPPRDLISFSPAPQSVSLTDYDGIVYPVIGLGGGGFSYAAEITNAQEAVDVLEAKYRAQGYTIPHWPVSSSTKLVALFSIFFRFSPSVTLMLEGGRAPLDEVTYASASLQYARDIGLHPRLLGSVSAGMVHLSLGIEHRYDVLVSPPEDYRYLDAIRISGGASGALLAAGIEWRPPTPLSVTLYGQYLLLPDFLATLENAHETRIALGGPGIGMKIHLLWY